MRSSNAANDANKNEKLNKRSEVKQAVSSLANNNGSLHLTEKSGSSRPEMNSYLQEAAVGDGEEVHRISLPHHHRSPSPGGEPTPRA